MPTSIETMRNNLNDGRQDLASLARNLLGVEIGQLAPEQRDGIVRQLKDLGYDVENVGGLVQENVEKAEKNVKEIENHVGPMINSLPNIAKTKVFNMKKQSQMGAMPPPAPSPETAPLAGATDAPPPPDGAGGEQPEVKFVDGHDVKDFLEQIGDPTQAIQEMSDRFANENSQVTDPASHQTGDTLQLIKDAVNDFYSTSDEQTKLDAASTLFETVVPDGQKENANPMDEGAVPAKYHKNPVGIAAAIIESNQAIKKLAEKNARKNVPFNLSKQAQAKTVENVIMHGPGENHVDQFLGHLISDWHLVERNKGFGLKLPGLLNLDWEKVWRSTIMDKYHPNYLENRFEIDRYQPNKLALQPGEIRRVTPNEYGITEARMEDARTQMNKDRGYEPSSKGEPFNWKKASKQAQIENDFEREKFDFNSGTERIRQMSDEALAYTLKDLNETIELQEQSHKAGYSTPKLGYYHDERHTVLQEIQRRKNNPNTSQPQNDELKETLSQLLLVEKMTLAGAIKTIEARGHLHECGKCFKWKKCKCKEASEIPTHPVEEVEDSIQASSKMVDPIKRSLPYNASSSKKKVTLADDGQVGSGLKPLPELKLPGEKTVNTNTLKKCPRCQGDLAPPHNYCPNCKTGFPGAVDTGQVRTGPAPAGQQMQPGVFIQPNTQLRAAASVDDAISNDGGIFFDGKSFVCYAKKKKRKFDSYEEAEEFKQVKKIDPQKDPAAFLMRQREKEPLDFKQLPASPQVNPSTIQHSTPQVLQQELLKKKRMQNMPSDPTCRVHDHTVADNLGIEG